MDGSLFYNTRMRPFAPLGAGCGGANGLVLLLGSLVMYSCVCLDRVLCPPIKKTTHTTQFKDTSKS